VPIYGRYDWFSKEGSGRPEFISILQRFIVKKRFSASRQVYLDASPITKVRPDAPPFFILHGEDDSIIPVGEGREFAEALAQKSDEVVVYSEIPHAQHAFDFFGSPHGHFTATAVAHFLDWVKAKRG
jgi:acetyl esterase/lipase